MNTKRLLFAFALLLAAQGAVMAEGNTTVIPTPPETTQASSHSGPTTTQATAPQIGQESKHVLPQSANSLSPAEWQKLRLARKAALTANPALLKTAMELSKRMRIFQKDLDAAMIKTDPHVAPIVDKIENGPGRPQMSRIPLDGPMKRPGT